MKSALILIGAVIAGFMINKIIGFILLGLALCYGVYACIPSFYAYKGNMAYSKDDLETTKYWYKKAYNRSNASVDVKTAYSFVLLKTGEPEEAEKVLNLLLMNKYVKPQKRNAAKQTRCMAVYKQGRLDEAMEECRELFENYKNTAMYGMLGYFMILKNEPLKDCLDFCLEAYDYNSDDRDILDNLSIVYYKMGEYKKAREISDALLENEKSFVEGYYHRALIEEKLGNIDKAKEMIMNTDDAKWSYMTTVSHNEIDRFKSRLGIK